MIFSLVDFINESNRIEGIHRWPTAAEIRAHEKLLALDKIMVEDLEAFVSVIQPGARLRERTGLDVRVADHIPPAGGPHIGPWLTRILEGAAPRGDQSPLQAHHSYEALHPFTDGNGRSGRALWLWQMGGIEQAPLGFLHTWYYQTLKAQNK